MSNLKGFLFLFFSFFALQISSAQLGISHEIGIIAGPVAFQSDFGERSSFETNIGNTGIGIGFVHYINFAYRADCNCYTTDNYFNDHFKIRTELSWNKTKLEHLGKWVESRRQTEEARRLRAHTGEAQNFDIGLQLEYYPRSIREYSAGLFSFAPFFSLGAHYVAYNPRVKTTYVSLDPTIMNEFGNIDDPTNFYSFWEPGSVTNDSDSTWSIVGSVGTRYQLSPITDLMIDFRVQYFFSDTVDGLDHQLPSNQTNDWLVWLNFGYIYYLD